MTTRSQFWLINFFAIFFGALLTIAFAPFNLFPAAIIAFIGLLALTLNASSKRAAFIGFLFGLGLFGSGVYWVFISIHFFGDVPNTIAAIITMGLIALLALFPAAVCYFTNRYFPSPNTAKIVFSFPAIWVISEYLRGILLNGFPWLLVGYSQTNSPLKGFAPILSVYGVSFAVVLSSALLLNTVLKWKQKQYRSLCYQLGCFFLIWIAAALLSFIPWTQPIGKPIDVSLVQGNIPQSIKWSPEHIDLSLKRYDELTQPLWGKDKLIIWPESAIPLPIMDAADFIQMLDEKATQTESQLILGIPIESTDKKGYYNAIVSLGKEKKTYLKRRLVPFGEYTPMQNWLAPIFNALQIPMSNLIPGNYQQAPLILNNVKILVSICYEIAFPQLVWSNDRNIGYLLTVTNDAWFGDSSAKSQHLQMAAMRSIEMGRPALFVSNDGLTAIIADNGRVVRTAPMNKAFVLNGQIQPRVGLTPWMKNSTAPIAFILLCFIVIAIRTKSKTD
jgi:apolipoprotein N-acyltransferase